MPFSAAFPVLTDWMIVGVKQPATDQVMLIASNDLFEGSLEQDSQMEEFFTELGMIAGVAGPTISHFTTSMRTYTIVMGDTYGHAMESLLRERGPIHG